MDLNRIYFEPYRKVNSDDLSGLVTVGGELQLIQEEDYFIKSRRRWIFVLDEYRRRLLPR